MTAGVELIVRKNVMPFLQVLLPCLSRSTCVGNLVALSTYSKLGPRSVAVSRKRDTRTQRTFSGTRMGAEKYFPMCLLVVGG